MRSLKVQLPEGTRAPDLLAPNGRQRLVVPDSVMCDVTVDATARDNYRSSVGHYLSWHYIESDQRLEFGSARQRSFVTRPFGTFVYYFRHLVYVVGLVIDGQTGYVHGCITRVFSGGVLDREHVLEFKKEAHEKDYIKSRRIHRLEFNGNYTQGLKVFNVDLGLPILKKTIVDIATFRPGVNRDEPSPVLFQRLILYAAEAPRIRAVFRAASNSLSIPADGLNIEGPVVIRIPISEEPFVLNHRQLSSCALEFLRTKKFKRVTGTSPRNLYQILSSILLLRRNKAYPTQFIMPDAPREDAPDEPLQGPRGQQFTGKRRLELLNKIGTKYSAVLHGGERPYESENWIINLWEEAEKLCHHLLDVPNNMEIKMGRELDGEGRSWTCPVYIFNSVLIDAGLADAGEGRSWTVPMYIMNSELVDAAPGDEGDLPANNGNPQPFHGPVLPGEEAFVAQQADQFMAQLPNNDHDQQQQQQAPDQASNAGSVIRQMYAASSSIATAPQMSFQQAPGQEKHLLLATTTATQAPEEQIQTTNTFIQSVVRAESQLQLSALLPQLLNTELTPAVPTLVSKDGTMMTPQVYASDSSTTSLMIDKLQRLLNSNMVTIQASASPANDSIAVIQLTINIADGTTFSLTLPGKLADGHQVPIQHKRLVGNLATDKTEHVYTMNNQLIRKVYVRRTARAETPLIFAAASEEYVTSTPTLARKVISRKRIATPVSESSLKRGKRGKLATGGYKPSIKGASEGLVTRSKEWNKPVASPISISEGGLREMQVAPFGGDPRAAACSRAVHQSEGA